MASEGDWCGRSSSVAEDCLREYETWAAALPAWQPATYRSLHSPDPSPQRILRVRQSQEPRSGWQLPPTGIVTRTNPRLMNYFHMDFREGRVDDKEERLAQWNLLILNHDLVESEKLSLAKIRQINPRIKILAWVPLQGPNDGLAPGVPKAGENRLVCEASRWQYARAALGWKLDECLYPGLRLAQACAGVCPPRMPGAAERTTA